MLGKTNTATGGGGSTKAIQSLLLDFPKTISVLPRSILGGGSPTGGMFLPQNNDYQLNRKMEFDTGFISELAIVTYTIKVVPNIEGCQIIFDRNGDIIEANEIWTLPGEKVKYTVSKAGYATIIQTIAADEDKIINVSMREVILETVNLSYPFDIGNYQTFTLDGLIDGSNFIINNVEEAITNGVSSYGVNSGKSYGSIMFITPNATTEVSVTGYVSSEGNYDVGGVYVGTEIYEPTRDQIQAKTTDGKGSWLFSQSGSNASDTYTASLLPNTIYYLNFAYAKDGSGSSLKDRLIITNIQFISEN